MAARHDLAINRILCDGHGVCAGLLPEMITLDEWGYPIIPETAVSGDLLVHAHRAVRACPLQALRLMSLESGKRR